MVQQSLFEKLQINDHKNILIQGLPSSIEKQFVKLSYAKNVTPLLKIKKIDFALIFAISTAQLNGILKDVIPHLNKEGKLWVAYPKSTSKIASDLNRDCSWKVLTENHFVSICEIVLDHCWTASWFKQVAPVGAESMQTKGVTFDKSIAIPPVVELETIFTSQENVREAFQSLSKTNQKEYVEWIEGAKRKDTRTRRVEATVEKLLAGKRNPLEK